MKGKLSLGILGMVLGDLSGLPFGGLVGFFAGALAGHLKFDLPAKRAERKQYQQDQRKRGRFIYHAFALGAKVAKSDGAITRAEINRMEQAMRQEFRLTENGRTEAIKIWNDSKRSERSFENFCKDFMDEFGKERHRIMDMMDFLFSIAAADGRLHPREELLLHRASGLFQVHELQFQRKKNFYFYSPPKPQTQWHKSDPFYAILGASPQESLEDIKKKYRELAKKWHPDKLVAAGASAQALRHAKEKLQQVNEAWEYVQKMKR